MNFKAVLALPKMARSAQTHKRISFIWIVWSTLYVYLWQLRHLWSNCKMLWATRSEFECIKKNSNLEWNLILVSWAFFYTHNTVEKSNRGKLFSQFNYCYLTWLHLYCSIFKKEKENQLYIELRFSASWKIYYISLTKWIIFGPCTAIPYRASTGPEQGFPSVVFPHGENQFY